MKGAVYVTMLYCMAAVTFLLGLMALYETLHWRFSGHEARMVLSKPAAVPSGPIYTSGLNLDVKYLEPGGAETEVDKKWISADMAKHMANGEAIKVRFIPSDPMATRFPGDEGKTPWGWLAGGVVLFFVARFARKLAKQESVAE
ncbi:MAG TPA: hypothetical protein VF798_11910 [Burkholderiaceae bacterium]